MRKIKLEILGLSSSQSEMGHFALILGEEGGMRRLPIIIDGFMARAIALELENIRPNRPMTHDLFMTFAKDYGIQLLEVVISNLKDGVFYSTLVFDRAGEIKELDSRTSDAVALAVRFSAPIFVEESVMNTAGIEVEEDFFVEEGEEESQEMLESFEEEEEEEEMVALANPSDRLSRLKEQMEEAIDQEDYERAARLRDEIDRLEQDNN